MTTTTNEDLSPPPPAPPPPSPPPHPLLQPLSKAYTLTAASISYTKPAATLTGLTSRFTTTSPPPPTAILHSVSFSAHPSRLLAIVGPSGAGKSTLLNILSTHTTPTSGRLLLNSSPLRPASFRKLSSHLPQHDSSAALPLLTVSEAFLFAASLLLPHTTPSEAAAALLFDLNLSHVAHTRLSGHLSGGERRRVSIGLSLLKNPAVLLLDEPTSGLDSASAFSIMATLQSIASARRRTVIVTIHQPSFRILETIDDILLLHKGGVLHHGSIPSLDRFLLSNGFTTPPQLNPLEYAMEIANQLLLPPSTTTSPPTTPTSMGPIRKKCDVDDRADAVAVTLYYRSSRLHEVVTLYFRFLKVVCRTKQLLLTNTLEALGVGLLLGTIYTRVGHDRAGIEKRFGLFAFTLTFLLSSTTEALPIFVGERAVVIREASSGVYRLSSHVVASTLVFVPYLFSLALMYSAAVYFLVGLCGTFQAFSYFVAVTWAVVLMANSFVLFVSSLAPNYIAGTSLVTVSLAGFFLFSGYFIGRDKMPGCWVAAHYLSLYKYALDALLLNEYACLRGRCFEWVEEGRSCALTGGGVLAERGLRVGERWSNVQVMLGYFLLYRVLYWAVLARRVSMSKK